MQLTDILMSYVKNDQYKVFEHDVIHRAFFENNPMPMWIHDVDSRRFIGVNRAALKKYGYSRDEFLTKTLNDIHPNGELVRMNSDLQAEIGNLKVYHHRLKNGKLIAVETSSHELDYDGRRAVFTIVHDLADQNRIQADENEKMGHDLIESMPVGYYRITQDGFFLEANPAFVRMLGRTDEELLYTEAPDELCFICTEAEMKHMDRSFSSKPEIYRLRRKDGTEMWVADTFRYVQDNEGDVIYREGLCRQITDREAREQKNIEDIHPLQSAALNAVNNAVAITDKTGKIEWVNPAFEKLTGYSAFRAVGMGIGKLIKSGKQDKAFYKDMWDTILSGKKWHGQLINRRVDGTLYNESMTITPISGDEGAITHFIAVKEDITERKYLEDELTQAQKMEEIGRLAGGVAHDYNNVLGVILGYSELIKVKLRDEESIRRQLDAIIGAAKRGADLTKRLLSFARKEVVSPKTINVNSSIDSLKEMLQQIVGENRGIVFNLEKDLWNIKLDPTQMDQVLVNLATNARDAIEDVGTITIGTTNVLADEKFVRRHVEFVQGEYVKVSIADTGKGIDEVTLKRIFDPFFTTKPSGKGTGLGLAMVYAIVKQNAGNIEVKTEPGEGTRFDVYFPRSNEEAEKAAEEFHGRTAMGDATVLVVEDRPDLLESSKKSLEQYGYRVLTALDPQEALSLCKNHSGDIDLLLVDVIMPSMNGAELSRKISKIKPKVRTLFMSGYTADVLAAQGAVRKRIAFIQKPFTPQALAKKLQEVLAKT